MAMGRPSRLGYGDGSVYREKETGRWRGELRTANGRRRVSGWTEAEANSSLRALRRELDNGSLEGDTRLGEWIDWWLANVEPLQITSYC